MNTTPEWAANSQVYADYLAASTRCAAAFAPAPQIRTNAWTHPGTGEVRYYLDTDDLAAAAGYDPAARVLAGVDEHLSKNNVRHIADYLYRAKFWVDAAGVLHQNATGLHFTYREAFEAAIDRADIIR
ncbi:hypothetical protein AB0B28_08060 [Glycomyces sp. NPDC046736]|uniref:hypothetical protein n=1 Tax=Glycomyces sp. NPDC046736 TaxID=3155615 RepID=UPI0033E911C9